MASRELRDLTALKRGVRTSLPEVDLIEETSLREQVIELHAVALSETTFARIEDIPASGVPESPLMSCGTQADHYRGVALIAIGMLDGMRKAIPALSVDHDILIAGALVHDVGKAYEFANWNRWKAGRSHSWLASSSPSRIRRASRAPLGVARVGRSLHRCALVPR